MKTVVTGSTLFTSGKCQWLNTDSSTGSTKEQSEVQVPGKSGIRSFALKRPGRSWRPFQHHVHVAPRSLASRIKRHMCEDDHFHLVPGIAMNGNMVCTGLTTGKGGGGVGRPPQTEESKRRRNEYLHEEKGDFLIANDF